MKKLLRDLHGSLCIVGFGIIIPLSVVIANRFKDIKPQWFFAHVILSTLGIITGVSGTVIGVFYLPKNYSLYQIHYSIGYSIIILVGMQIVSLVIRPSKTAITRPYWDITHYWIGRSITILSIVISYRSIIVFDIQRTYLTYYTWALSIVFLLWVGKECRDHIYIPTNI